MSTRSVIVKAESDGTYKASFVHFDGYLEKPGVGYILWHYYNSDAKAEKLVSLGDLQSTGRYITPSRLSQRYGWNDLHYGDHLENLSFKEQEALRKEDEQHVSADYRDQFSHSLSYKKQHNQYGQETLFPSSKGTGLSWDSCEPYHAKDWNDFLDNGPSDFEYLYLFHDHQWHCLVSNELGNTDLTIADTVKTIKDRQHQMVLNWKRSGKSDTNSLIGRLSDIEHDLNKGMSTTSMQILINSAYQRCHHYQNLYDQLGMHFTTLAFRGGYNDSAFKDGKLVNITDHDDNINAGHLPENKYQATNISDAINYIKDFAYQR